MSPAYRLFKQVLVEAACFHILFGVNLWWEAAAIDCKSQNRRFWTITFPLLAPTSFFLLILNITYAMFETFGMIDLIVKDQPGNSPVTLVYKVYRDGFRGNDLGGSSAQSVILMILVLALTVVQFRLIEKRVHYN